MSRKVWAVAGAAAITLIGGALAAYFFFYDPEGFFAYTHVPRQGQQTEFYVLLSKMECRFDDEGEEWKTALYYYPDTVGQRHACWRPFTDTDRVINICLVGRDGRGHLALSNACQPASKSKFIDTDDLPRNAQFQ
jgi:hypothetical protein